MSATVGPPNQTRPLNMPGMNRDNAPSSPVDPGLLTRLVAGARNVFGMAKPGDPELPFFPPGRPLDPIAQGAAGRRFDYPTAYNIVTRTRAYEPISFEVLRAMADPAFGGLDLLRLAIETRKDQVAKLQQSILPRKPANHQFRPKADERCLVIEEMLRRPDGVTSWQSWVTQLVEEHLVIDAATILRKQSVTGETIGLELIDGATIKPLLNYDGRMPIEGPAYQQVLKGLPAVDYTRDQLLYVPRNPRVSRVYGMSVVEQVLTTVNIALNRQAGQLGFYKEGNIPDAVAQVPEAWSISQIAEFQQYWDTLINDAVTRRKMRFIPAGVAFQQTRDPGALVDQFDEWIARVIAYAFSLPPTPFVRMVNRGTAETMYETSLSEGLMPIMSWLKSIIDYIIANWFGYPDIELVWDDIKKPDPAEREQRDLALIDRGVISRDDMRSERGMEPLGTQPIVQGIGPLGFMSITSMNKAIQNGWDLTGMPQPGVGPAGDVAAAMGAGPDTASLVGTGQDGDPLNGLPPELLDALGVASQPAALGVPGRVFTRRGAPGSAASAASAPSAQQPPPPAEDANGEALPANVVPLHRRPDTLHALQAGEAMAHAHARNLAGARR